MVNHKIGEFDEFDRSLAGRPEYCFCDAAAALQDIAGDRHASLFFLAAFVRRQTKPSGCKMLQRMVVSLIISPRSTSIEGFASTEG